MPTNFISKMRKLFKLNVYSDTDVSGILTERYIKKSNIAQAIKDLVLNYVEQEEHYYKSLADLKSILVKNLQKYTYSQHKINQVIQGIFDETETIENVTKVALAEKESFVGANGVIFIDKDTKPNFGLFDATFEKIKSLAQENYLFDTDTFILKFFREAIELYPIENANNALNSSHFKFLDRICTPSLDNATVIGVAENKLWVLPDNINSNFNQKMSENIKETVRFISPEDPAFNWIHPALYLLGNWQKEFLLIIDHYNLTNFESYDANSEILFDYILYLSLDDDLKSAIKNENVKNLQLDSVDFLIWMKEFLEKVPKIEKIRFTLDITPELKGPAKAAINPPFAWPLITAHLFYNSKEELQRYLRLSCNTIANKIQVANSSQIATGKTLINQNYTTYEFANFLDTMPFAKSIADGFLRHPHAATKQEYVDSYVYATGIFAITSYLQKQAKEKSLSDKNYIKKVNIFNAVLQFIKNNPTLEKLSEELLANLKKINVPKGIYSTEFYDLIFAFAKLPATLLVTSYNEFIKSGIFIPCAVLFQSENAEFSATSTHELKNILLHGHIEQLHYWEGFANIEIELFQSHCPYQFLQKVKLIDAAWAHKDTRFIGITKDSHENWFIELGTEKLFTTNATVNTSVLDIISAYISIDFKKDVSDEKIQKSLNFLLNLIPQQKQIEFIKLDDNNNSLQSGFKIFAKKNNQQPFKIEQASQQDDCSKKTPQQDNYLKFGL